MTISYTLDFNVVQIGRPHPSSLESPAADALDDARVVAASAPMAHRRRQLRTASSPTTPTATAVLPLPFLHDDLLPAPVRRADVVKIQGTDSMGNIRKGLGRRRSPTVV
jgi:hypothetical protein